MTRVEFFIGYGTQARTFGTLDMGAVPHKGELVTLPSYGTWDTYRVREVEHRLSFEGAAHKVNVWIELP
jgi:hypothetical protein